MSVGTSQHRLYISSIEHDRYHLPENLYGLVIAEPLQLNRQVEGLVIYLVEHFRVVGLLVLNYAVQLTFLLWIWSVETKGVIGDNDVCKSSKSSLALEFACIFVFLVSIFVDVRETIDMSIGMYHCPTSGYSPVPTQGVQHHQSSIVFDDEPKSALHRLGMKKQADVQRWTLQDMTTFRKVVIVITVVIPKFCIGVALCSLGASYIIASSDDENLILNTVAVNFVLDLDEILLYTFSTDCILYRLATVEGIPLGETNTTRIVAFFFVTICLVPFLVLATMGVILFHRRTCEY